MPRLQFFYKSRQHLKFSKSLGLIIFFLCSLTFCLWIGHVSLTSQEVRFGEVATAQSIDATQLVQQGVNSYKKGEFQKAIEYWKQALVVYQDTNHRDRTAIVRENLARTYQQIGQLDWAINYWQDVIDDYYYLGNVKQVGRMMTEQAQAYIHLGQPQKAIAILCGLSQPENSEAKVNCVKDSALGVARSYEDPEGQVAALGSLGEAYRLKSENEQAIKILEAATEINTSAYQSSILNTLGNAYFSKARRQEQRAKSNRLRGDERQEQHFIHLAKDAYDAAIDAFDKSKKNARTPLENLRANSNLILLDYFPKSVSLSRQLNGNKTLIQETIELLRTVPNSTTKLYSSIALATLKQPSPSDDFTLSRSQCPKRVLEEFESEKLLQATVAIARNIGDSRAESFALGELGHISECNAEYQQALNWTNQARLAADKGLFSKDSLYLWEWQIGRIYLAQGLENEAIDAYQRAIAILEGAREGQGGLRGDILIAQQDLQFDFRDTIEPLYRELAKLLLERAARQPKNSKVYKNELNLASLTIDSLKLAELQNYFGDDCLLAILEPRNIDELASQNVAVFRSIIFKDKVAIIANIPDGENRRIKFEWIADPKTKKIVDRETLIKEIITYRRELESYRKRSYNPEISQKLYDWIIRPFASDLDPTQIETLVFIPDGLFRSIPMSALHDGDKFLVETYAIATTPSLQLTASQPLTRRQKIRILALGLTNQVRVNEQDFPALPGVQKEMNAIQTQFPDSQVLLDDKFTSENLQHELSQAAYQIVHIATHGEFGTLLEDSFLVTGNSQKFTITDLERTIRNFKFGSDTVEFLVLTACQTAVGDDRTTLGLAGIAMQAGVSSALASLWFIPDAPTAELVSLFYKNFSSQMGLAQALQEAQKKLIKQEKYPASHPASWASFVIFGNWM